MSSTTPNPEQIPSPNIVEPVTGRTNPSPRRAFQIQASTFSGPIPPPEIIEGYENILPGAADRILKMAEDQSSHRRAMEKKEIDSINLRALLGLILAFVVMLVVILVGGFLIYENHPVAGLTAMISAIGYIIYTFICGKKADAPPKKS